MKKLLLRVLLVLIPFFWWIYASAQPKKVKDCSTTCFNSEIVSAEQLNDCVLYEIKVSFSGDCAHALSHFSVAIPCGTVSELWNSENWRQELGTDPTTGVAGFKIDDIEGFGEGGESSFRVRFKLCSADQECASELDCWQPVVAYKAATCVNYQTITATCSPLKASITQSDVSCHGAQDGTLAITVEEGREPFSFQWSDGSAEQSRTNLPAGGYSVVVQDASGSAVTLQAEISEPPALSLAGIATPSTCNGMADGSVDLTVSGGTGAYQFSWNTGATTEDLTSVQSGFYSVTVKDESGCQATQTFSIGNVSSLSVNGKIGKPDCNSDNGSIDITVTGGAEPYSFEWSNGASTEDLAGIGSGLYQVKITDSNGCFLSRAFLLTDNNTLKITGISASTSCTDEPTGSIDLTVSGGTAPYTFSWSNGDSTEDPQGLTSGYYTVVVTDEKGCQANAGFTVTKKTFQVPRVVVQPKCNGDANGSITLGEPIGGTAPFTYEWSTGGTGTSLTDLAPGTYSVTVTDAEGCSRTVSATITAPPEILINSSVTNSSCNAEGSYAIDIVVSGGTAPYSYAWSDSNTSEDRSGLTSGTYSIVVADANGCSASSDIIVDGEDPVWSCLINPPGTSPECSSTGNVLSTDMEDADSYEWSISSSDNSWTITSGADGQTVTYSAGASNTSATFTLTITRDGCSQSCSYSVNPCTPTDNNGEEPGGEEPGGEEPGGEEPGGEEPGGGSETCEECFESTARIIAVSGSCRTYEMQVNTDGQCRHDLSHWVVAIPCGTVSNYSNSEGWKMEYGKDPTTGLYGLKVDDIPSFGKEVGSFTVRFTICESNCDLAYWDPTVAYKAGQCVAMESIDVAQTVSGTNTVSVYPNPFTDEINFEWSVQEREATIEIIDQYGNTVSRTTQSEKSTDRYTSSLQSSSLPRGMYYYRILLDGKVFNGKISKR